MKIDMNQLLQQALSTEGEPDFWLNQNIMHRVKEKKSMTNKFDKLQLIISADDNHTLQIFYLIVSYPPVDFKDW